MGANNCIVSALHSYQHKHVLTQTLTYPEGPQDKPHTHTHKALILSFAIDTRRWKGVLLFVNVLCVVFASHYNFCHITRYALTQSWRVCVCVCAPRTAEDDLSQQNHTQTTRPLTFPGVCLTTISTLFLIFEKNNLTHSVRRFRHRRRRCHCPCPTSLCDAMRCDARFCAPGFFANKIRARKFAGNVRGMRSLHRHSSHTLL